MRVYYRENDERLKEMSARPKRMEPLVCGFIAHHLVCEHAKIFARLNLII